MTTLVAVYPLIRAKFVLQARGSGANVGLLEVLRRIALDEGLRGLYSGLGAQLRKSLLSSGLMLAVKEQTEKSWRTWLLRPMVEPVPRAGITTPPEFERYSVV